MNFNTLPNIITIKFIVRKSIVNKNGSSSIHNSKGFTKVYPISYQIR